MRRYKRNDKERKAYFDKRMWAGRNYALTRTHGLRDESGKILSSSRLALRYDFLRPELRAKDKMTKNVVHYWRQKAADPTLHDGLHGGRRHDKFSDVGWEGARDFVCAAIWKQINDFPDSQLPILTTVANQAAAVIAEDRGLVAKAVSQKWVARLFKDWRWSWKVPTVVQLHKFTPENISRYVNYLVYVAGIPLHRLKFTDEIHWISRGSPSPYLPFLSSPASFFEYEIFIFKADSFPPMLLFSNGQHEFRPHLAFLMAPSQLPHFPELLAHFSLIDLSAA